MESVKLLSCNAVSMAVIDTVQPVWEAVDVNGSRKNGSVSSASLADQAYYAIRELILRGKLSLGTALSRRKLATELRMSLLPISEAMRRLEDEGLVESKPQVGTRVRVPSEQDVRDRFLIREALESQSARVLSERATLQQRQELKQMAQQMDTLMARLTKSDSATDAEFVFAVHSYHFQFHMRLAEYSGCMALQEMIQKNNVLVFNWLYDLVGHKVAVPLRFHSELVEAIAAGDPEAADRAMRVHVRFGLEDTVSAIKLLQPHLNGKWRLGRSAVKMSK